LGRDAANGIELAYETLGRRAPPVVLVPAGHGHKYTTEYVDGWNAVVRSAGITAEDLASLRKIIAAGE